MLSTSSQINVHPPEYTAVPVSLLEWCWIWVQSGDPLYAAVFSLSSCHGHICPILVIFLQKAHIHCWSREEKLWSKFYFNPLIMDGFKGGATFPELKSNFHNWGAASVMMSTTIAAAKFMNFGCFLPRLLCEQPLPSLVDTRSLLGALRFWWPYLDPQLLHFSPC